MKLKCWLKKSCFDFSNSIAGRTSVKIEGEYHVSDAML